MIATGGNMGVPICDQYAGINIYVTRSFAVSSTSSAKEDTKVKVYRQVISLLHRLENDLCSEILSDSAKERIKQTRLVTDLKMFAVWVQSRHGVLVSHLEMAKHLATVHKIIPTIKDVPNKKIIFQFKKFFERLEQEIKSKKVGNLDSKELTKML